jgi:hypothetical protein
LLLLFAYCCNILLLPSCNKCQPQNPKFYVM